MIVASLELGVVREFNVERFRQKQTQTPCDNGGDSIYHHGYGVVVDLKGSDQGSQDACHTGTYRVDTQTVLPVQVKNGLLWICNAQSFVISYGFVYLKTVG